MVQMMVSLMKQYIVPNDTFCLSLDPEDDPAMITARNRRQRIDRARALIDARIKGEAANESETTNSKRPPNPRTIAHSLRHALKKTPS